MGCLDASRSLAARCTIAALALTAAMAASTTASADPEGLAEHFEYIDPQGEPDRPIKVFTYVPASADADTPIVFVMHGAKRNASDYRDTWIELADRYRVIAVAPQFPKRQFPGRDTYAAGFVRDGRGRPVPREWNSFTRVDHLFDTVKARYSNRTPRYYMFGHSAGGQFVHRFVLNRPERLAMAVAANPGRYSQLDYRLNWPLGLSRSDVDAQALTHALSVPMVLLLGERDNGPKRARVRARLRRMKQARLQAAREALSALTAVSHVDAPPARPVGWERGLPHDRAHRFFDSARTLASAFGVDFAWSIGVVPRTGHNKDRMSAAAAAHMFGHRLTW